MISVMQLMWQRKVVKKAASCRCRQHKMRQIVNYQVRAQGIPEYVLLGALFFPLIFLERIHLGNGSSRILKKGSKFKMLIRSLLTEKMKPVYVE